MANSLIEIPGYNLIRQDRDWNNTPNSLPKRGGGVGAFINTNHGFSLQHLQLYNRKSNYLECLLLEIYFEHCKNITSGVVYRPPSGNVSKFCEELTDIFQDIIDLTGSDVFRRFQYVI